MIDILLCDFEDSFTYNIYSELTQIYAPERIEVCAYTDQQKILDFIIGSEKKILILGPGPGHPDDYLKETKFIVDALRSKNIFIMGICLGHQLVWHKLGAKIVKSVSPCHGQKVSYALKSKFWKALFHDKKIEVQRYNSLAVELNTVQKVKTLKNLEILADHNEVIASYADRLITYQFHPESVGTTFPQTYFSVLKDFLI